MLLSAGALALQADLCARSPVEPKLREFRDCFSDGSAWRTTGYLIDITLRLEGCQLELGEDFPSYQQGRPSAEVEEVVVGAAGAVVGWTICWWEAHY